MTKSTTLIRTDLIRIASMKKIKERGTRTRTFHSERVQELASVSTCSTPRFHSIVFLICRDEIRLDAD
jgi:hypothetical protein